MPDLGARRWWALGVVSLAVLCVGLDATVLSVALPKELFLRINPSRVTGRRVSHTS
jgi:hypothetical protein